MPVYRGPDGKIIEEKTSKTEDGTVPADREQKPLPPAPPGGRETAGGSDEPTRPGRQPAPEQGGQVPGAGRLDEPTKPMGQQPSTRCGGQAPGAGRLEERDPEYGPKRGIATDPGRSDERTRINVGDRRKQEDRERLQEREEKADGMDDPVVGWLAVVEGPGKGKAMQLGYGSNPIGRGGTARVSLDFGDNQVSRGGHAIVTYDPRGRKFSVQHGGGTNLTYLEDQPVLIPAELLAHRHISIGATVLRFVPLCGDAFDWQDTEERAKD